MRTDVKLGVVISMVVVLAAGGYFLFSGKGEPPVPVASGPDAANATKAASNKPATNSAKARPATANRDAASRPGNPPAGNAPRDNRLANKPADRPSAPPTSSPATAKPPPVQPQPGSEVASAGPAPSPSVVTSETKPVPLVADAKPAVRPGDPSTAAPTNPGPSALTATPLPVSPPITSTISPPSGAQLPLSSPATVERVAASTPTIGPGMLAGEPTNHAGFRIAAVDTHKVQPGDSLATLAHNYYGNAKYSKFLADSNPQIADPAKLTLGTVIKIPTLPPDIDAKLAAAPPSIRKSPAAPTGPGGKRTYKVQAGDSFYRIAKDQLGNANRWKELFNLNKSVVHNDPTQLQVGQTLVLPDS